MGAGVCVTKVSHYFNGVSLYVFNTQFTVLIVFHILFYLNHVSVSKIYFIQNTPYRRYSPDVILFLIKYAGHESVYLVITKTDGAAVAFHYQMFIHVQYLDYVLKTQLYKDIDWESFTAINAVIPGSKSHLTKLL